jgi:hypothetical protein
MGERFVPHPGGCFALQERDATIVLDAQRSNKKTCLWCMIIVGLCHVAQQSIVHAPKQASEECVLFLGKRMPEPRRRTAQKI